MIVNYISLGERIKTIRKNKKISQNALAERIEQSQTFISYIENGSKIMSLETFVAIANELNISADDLLTDSLKVSSKAYDQEIVSIFSDCSESEMKLLLDSMKAIKKSLREYDKVTKSISTPNKRYRYPISG